MRRTDFIILFKKLLVTLALYLIPVLTVWAGLTLAGKFRKAPVSTTSSECHPPSRRSSVVSQ